MCNGGRAHYVIESKVQWQPFWLYTQQYQNDWLGGNFSCTMTHAHGPHCSDIQMSQQNVNDGASAHYVMVSKFQWKPFWLAIQLDPQNDWAGWQNLVNYDVFAAYAPLQYQLHWFPYSHMMGRSLCLSWWWLRIHISAMTNSLLATYPKL